MFKNKFFALALVVVTIMVIIAIVIKKDNKPEISTPVITTNINDVESISCNPKALSITYNFKDKNKEPLTLYHYDDEELEKVYQAVIQQMVNNRKNIFTVGYTRPVEEKDLHYK